MTALRVQTHNTLFDTPESEPQQAIRLRPYQGNAVRSIIEEWESHQKTLVVMPTGTGKTIVFADLIRRSLLRWPSKKFMVLAHRDELIRQAADKIEKVTGVKPGIEMGDEYASPSDKIVVSSVQTQNSKLRGDDTLMRMSKFRPENFGLLIVDEAHHSTAKTYVRCIDHYTSNPDLKVLGVTATPDRLDEQALGKIYTSVAFDYGIRDAISDGWLVPIVQNSIVIEGLDLSQIKTVAGDLHGGKLARIIEYEKNLLPVADATWREANGRKTLLFASSVAHAVRLCEIFNRYKADSSIWISGKTPKDERRLKIADYAKGKYQTLCNVGIATEGFDDPGIEVVAVARPTESRALYSQMVGRGTRVLPSAGIDFHEVGDFSAEVRKSLIHSSDKPQLEVIDFVGNAGRHKLMSCADILGGNCEDNVVESASKKIRESEGAMDVDEALEAAAEEIAKAMEQSERERKRRKHLKGRATYRKTTINPFEMFGLQPVRTRGWNAGRPVSEKMRAMLEKNGVNPKDVTWDQACQIAGHIISRREKGECSYKQAKLLERFGYEPKGIKFDEASKLITAVKNNGWQRPE